MIISKNNGKWTSAIFKIFWPFFWCKLTTFLRCPDSFIQSFWVNLENITKIMLKGQFSLEEFKLSCGTTSMTLRFIAAVLKINEFWGFGATLFVEFSSLVQADMGGCRLWDSSISRVIHHVTFYILNSSHWLKLQHLDWR